MTIASDGRGRPEYRLQIAGVGIEFVTSALMEIAYVDPETVARYDLLAGTDDVTLVEKIDPKDPLPGLESYQAKIIDRHDLVATDLLAKIPEITTYLVSTVSATATTIPVTSATGISAGDVVHMGTEALLVDSVSTSPDELTVTRGVFGSVAQAHFVTNGEYARRAAVHSSPPNFIGRRVFLYRYERGDDLQGDGTLIWRGVFAEGPVLEGDGVTWSFSVDSILAILSNDLGANLRRKATTRGIWIPSEFPMVVWAAEAADGAGPIADRDSDSTALGGSRGSRMRFAGFFESNEQFCSVLTDFVRAAFLAMDTPFLTAAPIAVPFGDLGWTFLVEKANGRSLVIGARGGKRGGPIIDAVGPLYSYNSSYLIQTEEGDSDRVDNLATGTRYYMIGGEDLGFLNVNGVPRGLFGNGGLSIGGTDPIGGVDEAESRRLYLDQSVDGTTSITIKWNDGGGGGGEEGYDIESVNTTDGYVVVDSPKKKFGLIFTRRRGTILASHAYTRTEMPEIGFARNLLPGSSGDFKDALAAIAADAPGEANDGGLPLVSTDDLDVLTNSVAEQVVDAAHGGKSWLAERRYVYSKPVKFDEWFASECQLLGVFPAIDSAGRVSLRPLRIVAATEEPDATITEIIVETSDGRAEVPRFDLDALGVVNSVQMKTGYDPIEDKYLGDPFTVQDLRSYAERPVIAPITIEPRSVSLDGDRDLTVEDVVDQFSKVLGFYGYRYATVDVLVPWIHFDVLLGDVVRITLPDTPNMAGSRGYSGLGQVIGREWGLGDAFGTLTLILHFLPIAGWTPNVTAVSASNVTGNRWQIVTSSTDPDGLVEMSPTLQPFDLDEVFERDTRVRAVEWDSETPTRLEGTMRSVTGSTIVIDFDGPWTFGTTPVGVVIGYADAGDVTDDQTPFFFVAGDDSRIAFATPALAKRFSV